MIKKNKTVSTTCESTVPTDSTTGTKLFYRIIPYCKQMFSVNKLIFLKWELLTRYEVANCPSKLVQTLLPIGAKT